MRFGVPRETAIDPLSTWRSWRLGGEDCHTKADVAADAGPRPARLTAGVGRRGGLRGANGRDAMVPGQHDYLSFLMGADAISDHELTDLGVKILKGASTPFRGLLVPGGS